MTKKMTIEGLAQMVANGFEKTATKQDLKELREEMRGGFSFLGQAIENLDVRISSYATEWNRRFDELHEWVEQLEDRLKSLKHRFAKT